MMPKTSGIRFYLKMLLAGLSLVLLVTALFAGCSPAGQGEQTGHDHVHGEDPYEWSGEYNLPAGRYTLEFQESDHDPSCMIAFLLLRGARAQLEHMAYHIMEAELPEIPAGGFFQVEDQHAFDLQLKPEGTLFFFEVVEGSNYLVFTEHFAWEFEMKIYDETGREIVVSNPTDYSD